MTTSIPRKAPIAITSYNGVFYRMASAPVLFFTEALHPFEVLTKAGFEVDLATDRRTPSASTSTRRFSCYAIYYGNLVRRNIPLEVPHG